MTETIEQTLKRIETECQEKDEKDRKIYEELEERLGNEIDEFNRKETEEGLIQINKTLDEVYEFHHQNKVEKEVITEEDMQEVAEMIVADESWE